MLLHPVVVLQPLGRLWQLCAPGAGPRQTRRGRMALAGSMLHVGTSALASLPATPCFHLATHQPAPSSSPSSSVLLPFLLIRPSYYLLLPLLLPPISYPSLLLPLSPAPTFMGTNLVGATGAPTAT